MIDQEELPTGRVNLSGFVGGRYLKNQIMDYLRTE